MNSEALTPAISICMSTYNGAAYLAEQIESLLAQTCQDWTLWVRDDGSGDTTPDIVDCYAQQYPRKIKVVRDARGRLGPSLSFGSLLEAADGEYFMFCDQDDVWLANKIELTLEAMKAAETTCPHLPLLVHSDLKVVDHKLNPIADSFWDYQRLRPSIASGCRGIIADNVVTGCTVMLNRAAKAVSVPIPPEAVMHDWWVAMTVAKHGKIIALPLSLTCYRQHENNRVGASRTDFFNLLKKMKQSSAIIRRHYKMVKKFDPGIWYTSVLFRKVMMKLLQVTLKR